ncbi:MAG: N-acyl-D-amino-acid deacylase [Actinomycetota bacterium]|jgi:N-acyl-D-amino-acid deacylase|nr:N-acyl-D-amino-acid deacylase [Actinomycetota bacterium]
MPERNDLVFKNVMLVDGTGSPARSADVAVAADRIQRVSQPNTLSGEHVVDGTNRVLAPGFIDIHSHADVPFLVDGRAHSAVTQGVTTVVPGNCGFGVAPFKSESKVAQKDMPLGGGDALAAVGDVSTFPQYLEKLRERGVGVNVVPLVAHGLLRASVAGFELREVTGSELATMTAMADEAMDAGAAGLSSGLEYAPGIASTTEELMAVTGPVGARGGLYATHCRNRGEFIVQAAEEGVRVAESSGARLQMSHFIRRPTELDRGLAEAAIDLLRAADDRGVRSRYDVFPFEYGPSPVSAFVPQKFRAEAGPEFGSLLQDRDFVSRITDELEPRFVAMLDNGGASEMYISDDGADGRHVGMTLGDVAARKRMPVAHAAIWLLSEAGERYGNVTINERWADWVDLQHAMADPNFIIMGDGSMANLDGPLAGKGFALSDWGHATATLGRFVRELELLSMEDAVRRMTSAPAEQLGLNNRGVVREGCAADLVLFDPVTVGSEVRPDNIRVVSTGIDEVLVNGVSVVSRGKVTDATPGLVGLSAVKGASA